MTEYPTQHVSSEHLHRESHCVTATETQRGETGLLPVLLQGVKQRREHTGARCADRVAERDRAAVYVDPRPIPAERFAIGERLHGERFVRLDEIVVGDLGAGFLHEVLHRQYWREET